MGKIVQGDFRPVQRQRQLIPPKFPLVSDGEGPREKTESLLPSATIALPQRVREEDLLAFLKGRSVFEMFTVCLPTPPGISEELWKFVSHTTLPRMAEYFKKLQGGPSFSSSEEVRVVVHEYSDLDLVLQIGQSDVLDWNMKPAFHFVLFQEAVKRFVPSCE